MRMYPLNLVTYHSLRVCILAADVSLKELKCVNNI